MKEKCPECGNTKIGGYAYLELGKRAPWCFICGLVLCDEAANSPTGFTQSVNEYYVPENRLLYDKGLGSHKQPKLDTHSHVAYQIKGKDKTLKFLFEENERITSELKLNNDVKEETAFLTRQLIKKTDLRGAYLEYASGSLIYISARNMHIPLELDEIKKYINYQGSRKLSVINQFIEKKLDLPKVILTAEEYLPKFVSSLHLGYQYEKEAREVLRNINLNGGLNKDKAAFSLLVTMLHNENPMECVIKECCVQKPDLVNLVKCVEEPLKSDIISTCKLSKTDVNKTTINETIKCEICGMELKKITYLHLKLHGMTLDDYRKQYPDAPLTSEQTRQNDRDARLGVKATDSTKVKQREAHLGKTSPMKGKHLTDDSKQKISKSLVKYFSEKREA